MPEGKKRLVRSLVRQPFSEDKEPDTEDYYLPTLYALAQPDPGNEVVLETVGKSGVKQLLLPKAIKKATDYRRWQTGQLKSVGLLGKLDQAFQELQTGQFEPNPDGHCLSCPYYSVICPARPA